MSSRVSRRSGTNASTLNVSTIFLLDRKRLIQELSDRHLDVTGNKNILAERLHSFIINGAADSTVQTPAKTVTSPPQKKSKPETKNKKTAKDVIVKVEDLDVTTEAGEVEESCSTTDEGSVAGPVMVACSDEHGSVLMDNQATVKTEIMTDDEVLESAKPSTPRKRKSCQSKKKLSVSFASNETDMNERVVTAPAPSLDESPSKRTRKKSVRLIESEQQEQSNDNLKKSEKTVEDIVCKPEILTTEDNDKRQQNEKSGEIEDSYEKFVKKLEKEEEIKIERTPIVKNVPAKRARELSCSLNSSHNEKSESIPKKPKSMPKPMPKPTPKPLSWKTKWAETMAEHKKDLPKQPIKQEVTKIKDNEKLEQSKKKVKSDSTIDSITALMTSSMTKKTDSEKSTSSYEPKDVPRAKGGSDASKVIIQSCRNNDICDTKQSHSTSVRPLFFFPAPSLTTHQFSSTLPPPFSGSAISNILPPPPPPPPPPMKRKSRFDQPPSDFLLLANVAPPAPPPILPATSSAPRKCSSPLPPPPPPPPKKLPSQNNDLKQRIRELFSVEDNEAVKNISVATSEVSSNSTRLLEESVLHKDSVTLQPNDSTDRAHTETSESVEVQNDFVIREITVPTRSETLGIKCDETDPNIGQRKTMETTLQGIKTRMALSKDSEEEYDPLEDAPIEVSTVYEYVPTNKDHDDEYLEEEESIQNEEGESDSDIGRLHDENEDDDNMLSLKHDPRDLLKLALPVLQSLTSEKNDDDNPAGTYCQMMCEEEENDDCNPKNEGQEEVYYHGDPVPEVDENELYEIAAGIKSAKKKDKKNAVQVPDEERIPADIETVELDYYNADIHVKSSENDIWQIEPFSQDGLALMWGGVRSNFGMKAPLSTEERNKMGKIGFQIEIESVQSIQHLPTDFLMEAGDVRVGFSLNSAPLVLGEYTGTWCISSSGKKATNNHFYDFGSGFAIGDVITSVMDFATGNLEYFKNGESLGIAFNNVIFQEGDVIFPTICVKNTNVNVNMGQDSASKWSLSDSRDWKFLTEIDKKDLIRTRTAPESKKDCTVLMTVGLPGVGKTTWVRRYLAEHPHENWTVISADVVMDAMRVNGVARIRLPTLKRPDFLRGIIGKSMARLILLAPRRRKNYVLDMANCINEKRKRKLAAFEEFNRKCMIFVPDEETHLKRLLKQEHDENEKIDTDALMQHKAAMSIPNMESDPFEEIIFIDPPTPHEHLAFERVQKMNTECRPWLVTNNRRRGGQQHHYNNLSVTTHTHHHGGNQYSNKSLSSGPPSSTIQTHISPINRVMNITHTTFSSTVGNFSPVKDGAPINDTINTDNLNNGEHFNTAAHNVIFDKDPKTLDNITSTFSAAVNACSSKEKSETNCPIEVPTSSSSRKQSINDKSSGTQQSTVYHPIPTTMTHPPSVSQVKYSFDTTVPPPNFLAPPPPLSQVGTQQYVMLPQQTDQHNMQFYLANYPPPNFTPR